MTTENKSQKFNLHVYRDIGADPRVRNAMVRQFDLPSTGELAAVMKLLREPANGYSSITPLTDWKWVDGPGSAILHRTYEVTLESGAPTGDVLIYQNQRIEYARYLLPYMAIHLDSDWDDADVLREAVDSVLWRWGVDAANGFEIDFTTRADVGDDITAVDGVFSSHGYPYEKGVRAITYDRRVNVLVAELSADKEAKNVAYPILG